MYMYFTFIDINVQEEYFTLCIRNEEMSINEEMIIKYASLLNLFILSNFPSCCVLNFSLVQALSLYFDILWPF